ncbi:alpha/beta hydrolase [Gemmatimonas phototrophica]|nr:alpha/beta hydrolase family protein [Gemmatimonas phototrophica]
MRAHAAVTVVALVAALMAPSAAAAQQTAARQGTVRTDTLWAQSLGVRKALTVYLPPSYGTSTRRYPLLVYLHGRGGNERDWTNAGLLHRTMDSLVSAGQPEAIIAMPDGDDGWYTTWASLPDAGCATDTVRREPAATYCVPWPHYDDYIARDIVAHLDGHYRTVGTRESRGIAGLSMGGYGALTLALAYPDVFAAAVSHSGVLSPRLRIGAAVTDSLRYGREMNELAAGVRHLWPSLRAVFGSDTLAWRGRDPALLAERLKARVARGEAQWPALRFDIGVDDTWTPQNRDLAASLRALGVAHEYTEYPGAHTWTYWKAHAAESLVFLLTRTGGKE